MRKTSLFLPAFLFAGLAGCTLSSTDEGDTPIDQEFLFEVEYVNFAWGLTWKGFYVDHDGDVWTYELDAPWPHADASSYTAQELLEKYEAGRVKVAHVDGDRLRRMFDLVDDAARGTLTDPVNRCADAGEVSFRAWSSDTATERYRPVLLRQEGDWARENTSAAARELYSWLKSLVPGFGLMGCEP